VVEKLKRKRPHGRTWHRREDNIKMDLRPAEYDSVDWMHVARIKVQWQAFGNTVIWRILGLAE
jgi:hypothetical protein